MSAYPFGALTWAEMLKILVEKHSVVVRQLNVNTPHGVEEIFYLTRLEGSERICHLFPILYPDDEFLSWAVVRNICDGLKVPPADFGLPIG
jgi:hypothetical protein